MSGVISEAQTQQAARAGVYLLRQSTTLIPGHLLREALLLESLLRALASGEIRLVESNPPENAPPDETGDVHSDDSRGGV